MCTSPLSPLSINFQNPVQPLTELDYSQLNLDIPTTSTLFLEQINKYI